MDQKKKARGVLAQFITDAADAIDETYWFSIRGECESSLCVHTMLTMDEYTELLYVAELISIGRKGPQLSKFEWQVFLREEGLCPEGDVQNAVAEVERAQVDLNKLKALRREPMKPKDLLFIRIGRYEEEGVRARPAVQYRQEIPPPGFNRRLISAHRRFRRDLNGILGCADSDTIDAIKTWINWSELMEVQQAKDCKDIDIHNNLNQQSPRKLQHNTTIFSPFKATTTASSKHDQTPSSHQFAKGPITPSPTHEAKRKPHYSSESPLSKYRSLNFLECNLMDRGDGKESDAILSRINMDNVLRDIIMFKQDHNEELTYRSTNSKQKYALHIIPMADNSNTFYKRAKRGKSIENLLSNIVIDGSISDGFECIVEYMLRRHEESAREVLQGLGVTPKVMDEFEVAAIMTEGGIGLSQWREIVRCLKTYMRLDTICVPEKMYSQLAADIEHIKTGTYPYQKDGKGRVEDVKWWSIDAAKELTSKLDARNAGLAAALPRGTVAVSGRYLAPFKSPANGHTAEASSNSKQTIVTMK